MTPLARIVEYSDAAVNPVDWPVAPAKGIQELLQRAGKFRLCNIFLASYRWWKQGIGYFYYIRINNSAQGDKKNLY